MLKTNGVAPDTLTDDDLARELARLYATRLDTLVDGSADALLVHTNRMLELEEEYLRRSPDDSRPHPLRTREGSRENATSLGIQPPPR